MSASFEAPASPSSSFSSALPLLLLSPSSSTLVTDSDMIPTPECSCFYNIRTTSYGGRGAFASKAIPKGAVILECEGPYASVVLRKFRREVCAWCFAWSFESEEGRKGSWSIRLDNVEHTKVNGGSKASAAQQQQWTPWFCGVGCRDGWVRGYSWGSGGGDGGEDVGVLVNLMGMLEKTLISYRSAKVRAKGKKRSTSAPAESKINQFAFLDTWGAADVSGENLDSSWKLAETATNKLKGAKMLEILESWNDDSSEDPTDLLTEFEADCARFVLDGLLRQALESRGTSSTKTQCSPYDEIIPGSPAVEEESDQTRENIKSAGCWPHFLRLQNNEIEHLKRRPYMLAMFVRVYVFLKYVVLSASPAKQKSRLRDGHEIYIEIKEAGLLEALTSLLETSLHVRAILARDHGNVFGIWDKGTPDSSDDEDNDSDSEMLGWGMYVFGSYFNHDCTPTVEKVQRGRALQFITTQDVEVGQELCINYIDVSKGNGVVERNKELSKEWFFECGCLRCIREMTEVGMDEY